LRAVTFTARSMDVPPSKCLTSEGLSYGRLCEHTQAMADEIDFDRQIPELLVKLADLVRLLRSHGETR
jgi:hypothetical protein